MKCVWVCEWACACFGGYTSSGPKNNFSHPVRALNARSGITTCTRTYVAWQHVHRRPVADGSNLAVASPVHDKWTAPPARCHPAHNDAQIRSGGTRAIPLCLLAPHILTPPLCCGRQVKSSGNSPPPPWVALGLCIVPPGSWVRPRFCS